MNGAYGRLFATFLIGVATSLIAAGLLLCIEGFIRMRPFNKKLGALALGMGLVWGIASIVIGLDIHYAVPTLDNLTLTDAEDRLSEQHLIPNAVPLDGPDVGLVVPRSQSLLAGQLVQSGMKITFNIGDRGVNTFDYPRTNGMADCTTNADGFCTINIEGVESTLVFDGRLRLVLWAKSVGSGWYVQDPDPTRPASVGPDQTWTREVQIGNSKYRPGDGELIDLALTVMSTRAQPTVGQAFSEPQGWTAQMAQHVSIRLVGAR